MRSEKKARKTLGLEARRYVARQGRKGRSYGVIAREMGVSRTQVRNICSRAEAEGEVREGRKRGRRPTRIGPGLRDAVAAEYGRSGYGVNRVAAALRLSGINVSDRTVRRIMREGGLLGETGGRSKQRKYIRYQRRYSNAMWHADWHQFKGDSLRRKWLVAYLDDASRCITGFGVFEHATAANSLLVLHDAIDRFGIPAQMLTDHGVQFTPAPLRSPRGRIRLNDFGGELVRLGIAHLLARVGHPETNGKIERFFGSFERERGRQGQVADYMSYYNERRLHFSLDMGAGETPRRAFHARGPPW